MLSDLGGWHFLIILAVVLLLFGATKLPALAKGVGQSVRIFRNEMGKPTEGEKKDVVVEPTVQSTTVENPTDPSVTHPKN
jgi:sec-independent protein translocase protein TatA